MSQSEPSIKDAAAKIEVSEKTLRRWLQEPTFAEAFRVARRESMSVAIAALQSATTEAVVALRQMAKDKKTPPASRVSAADEAARRKEEVTMGPNLKNRISSLQRAIPTNASSVMESIAEVAQAEPERFKAALGKLSAADLDSLIAWRKQKEQRPLTEMTVAERMAGFRLRGLLNA